MKRTILPPALEASTTLSLEIQPAPAPSAAWHTLEQDAVRTVPPPRRARR